MQRGQLMNVKLVLSATWLDCYSATLADLVSTNLGVVARSEGG